MTKPAERAEAERAEAEQAEAERLARLDVVRLRAHNAGPLTLSGSNTWVVGSDPAYLIDPGPAPADDAQHLARLLALLERRGGLGGIALTHDHGDHGGGLAALLERMPAPGSVPVAVGRPQGIGEAHEVQLADGVDFGPLRAVATPGHAPDHYAFVFGEACFTGDAVLGEGSVFIAPHKGALAGYLDGLSRLLGLPLQVLCPGHGPAVWAPHERLREYIEHRLERERMLRAGLDQGRRSVEELLDAAWGEVPQHLRPLAAVTLATHLDKLADEGLLPDGVERPQIPPGLD
ncbi:MAG TPA: MBL fold metallo-hydrolase [Solirubrobacteraceae bacterium]|jgi:glyoxylase-like metal-dependent hydrolase (beta-lactamase superfamily II)